MLDFQTFDLMGVWVGFILKVGVSVRTGKTLVIRGLDLVAFLIHPRPCLLKKGGVPDERTRGQEDGSDESDGKLSAFSAISSAYGKF